jgi:hypothetical protein
MGQVRRQATSYKRQLLPQQQTSPLAITLLPLRAISGHPAQLVRTQAPPMHATRSIRADHHFLIGLKCPFRIDNLS